MGNISINGKKYSGNNISMINGKVMIDGKEVDKKSKKHEFVIKIEKGAVVENIISDESIVVNGDCQNVVSKGSVNCDDVKGNIKARGSVNCDNVNGNVDAGGSVNCDDVKGSVNGRKVNHN